MPAGRRVQTYSIIHPRVELSNNRPTEIAIGNLPGLPAELVPAAHQSLHCAAGGPAVIPQLLCFC